MDLLSKEDFFSKEMLGILDEALPVAEESVADFYKMSTSRWGRLRYDVKTAALLFDHEHVKGAYAQVMRYVAMPWQCSTSASAFTVYRICLQDKAILQRMREDERLLSLPFLTFILVHELVHVVRFSKHLQLFDASIEARIREELRVQEITDSLARKITIAGMDAVRSFFSDSGGLGVDLF
ncbi:hypothetical protein [Desulfobotulus sp.]|uniref:hypothetical protein n=1 Tax=Desulfobotulus sp. TaxID=1940337 RepID=UPI002A36D2B0|nr:hypothetical protein [Desulfobotulus sp.]MDY0163754.1 hypothetical protein [Desulfobotulus sp.]